jgi:ribose transport system substrate-binding protein
VRSVRRSPISRRSIYQYLSFACLVTVVALVFSACGSDDKASSSSSGSEEKAAAPESAPEIGVLESTEVPEVEAKSRYKIALLAAHQADAWAISAAQAAKDYAEAHGVDLTIQDAGGYTEVQKQISQIQAAIAQKPDLIMIWATDPDAITPTLKEADKAGIKVLNFVVPATFKAPVVTSDYVAQAERMGDALAKSMGEKGKVISVIGGAGGYYASSLHQGLENALKKYPDIEWAKDVQIPDFDQAKTQQTVENWLTGNPDTTGVFVTTGLMGVGAAQAVRAAGLEDDQVKIVGSLLTDCAVLDMIREGRFSLLLGDPPVIHGELGVSTAISMLNGDEVPDAQFPKNSIFTPDNVDQAAEEGLLTKEVSEKFLSDCL